MLSNKLLYALPLVAVQAAAISLATQDEKRLTENDLEIATLDAVKAFYPDCEGLKNKGITYPS